jgi:GNAT superfamily N-acetyltransferase
MIVRLLDRHDSATLTRLDEWGQRVVARRDELVDCAGLPAAVADQDGAVVGVLTYLITGATCEILTLHAGRSWHGVGTALVEHVAAVAVDAGCTTYTVTTTNDNVDALRFYQRRGFRIVEIRAGAVDRSRELLKPAIPPLGDYGIPLRDEIELARDLTPLQRGP